MLYFPEQEDLLKVCSERERLNVHKTCIRFSQKYSINKYVYTLSMFVVSSMYILSAFVVPQLFSFEIILVSVAPTL